MYGSKSTKFGPTSTVQPLSRLCRVHYISIPGFLGSSSLAERSLDYLLPTTAEVRQHQPAMASPSVPTAPSPCGPGRCCGSPLPETPPMSYPIWQHTRTGAINILPAAGPARHPGFIHTGRACRERPAPAPTSARDLGTRHTGSVARDRARSLPGLSHKSWSAPPSVARSATPKLAAAVRPPRVPAPPPRFPPPPCRGCVIGTPLRFEGPQSVKFEVQGLGSSV